MPAPLAALVLLGLAAAHAQDPSGDASAVAPAAAPAPAETAPAPAAPAEAAPAAAAPTLPAAAAVPATLTVERLALLRQYKARRISVRNETELRGGGTSLGFSSPGYGPAVVMTDPIYTIRTWGLYQGGQRLDTVTALDRLGADSLKKTTVDDIKTSRRRARTWFTAAGLGGAAMVAGMVGMRTATTYPEHALAQQITTGGTLVGIGGLIAGSFPGAKASRLERYPSAVLTPEQASEQAAAHNEALRAELGLSPQEVWLMEMGSE